MSHRRRIAGDGLAWACGLVGAALLRYDFEIGRIDGVGVAVFAAAAVGLQLVVGVATGLYLGRARPGSFDEVSAIARCALWVSAMLFSVDMVMTDRPVPLSTTLGGGLIALVLMSTMRYVVRAREDQRRRPTSTEARRVIVFGAGEAGAEIVSALLRDPTSPYLPVAMLDDDALKRHLRIMGVPVVGTRHHIVEAANDHQADTLLVAIPSATASLLRDLAARAHDARLEVKVLPTVGELVTGDVAIGDIRTPTDADLLGRQQIDTDLASIAHYLQGKRVLVTGAGGSIGSELCRQIAAFDPANLIMVDRNESALHAVQLSIEGRALLDSSDIVLLDLRDRVAVDRLLQRRRPEVIFHAAALKHLPLLERFPGEAVQSNVWVTTHLLEAAAEVGVEKFVNISTDKAADPSSVLGYSKRIAERVTAYFAERAAGIFISVRFGNVLGSSGSVLPAFRAQIENGGPVTVTHPDVTRYFMTVHEAVQLVIQAAVVNGYHDVVDFRDPAAGARGEALVLDMGEPVRIDDVARRMIDRSGMDIEIVYTGLRPGEKLNETLFAASERVLRKVHPLISHVEVPPLDPERVLELDPRSDPAEIVAVLRTLAASSTVAARGINVTTVPLVDPRVGLASSPVVPTHTSSRQPAPVTLELPRNIERPAIVPTWRSLTKRALDVIGASAALVVAMPVLLVVATLVRLHLGTPVLFRQPRMGRHDRSFKLVKFRTMVDTRDADGRLLPDAVRLTRLGRFLRATSLDELPELWNVLCGDMSLVGPRPLPVNYLRRYTSAERRRHAVRPGVTGWSQVHGRNSIAWEDRLAHDVWYVENQSLWLDLWILLSTVLAVVRRNGISADGHVTMPELRPQQSAHPVFRRPVWTKPAAAVPAVAPEASETKPRILLSPPDVRAAEREMLLGAIDSGWIAPAGPDLDAFEVELAARCGVPYAVALSSGTAALHLALLQVGVRRGDDVLVPTATFAATANAVVYCGARPCFIDVDPGTWQMSPSLLAEELAERAERGTLPAAVITVDLYGGCADYDAIERICAEYGVPVIEDAAEALGAAFAGRPAGSFGSAGVLSFNGNKIVTTSSGGALLLHDSRAADRARYLAAQARQPEVHYEHTEVGFNYRMSNLLAAFGRGQLLTLDERVARRREINLRYRKVFRDVPGVTFQPMDPRVQPNAWLTCILVQGNGATRTRDGLRAHLETHNIETRPLWKPMHAQPVFAGNPARIDGTADHLFATGLCLPSGSGMTDGDLDRVVSAAREAFDHLPSGMNDELRSTG